MNHCIVYGSATLSRKYEVPKIKSYEKKMASPYKAVNG